MNEFGFPAAPIQPFPEVTEMAARKLAADMAKTVAEGLTDEEREAILKNIKAAALESWRYPDLLAPHVKKLVLAWAESSEGKEVMAQIAKEVVAKMLPDLSKLFESALEGWVTEKFKNRSW